MQKFKIVFNNTKDKAKFIDVSNKKDYDIDIKYGNSTYDGRSALSIMGLPEHEALTAIFNTNVGNVKTDFDHWIIV